MKKPILFILCLSLLGFSPNSPAADGNVQTILRATIADKIGWVDNPTVPNLCLGHYQNPTLGLYQGREIGEDESVISADAASLTRAGRSTLSGHVQVDQTTRQLTADTAEIVRDPRTGKISEIKLLGHIQVREPGRLLVGAQAVFHQPGQTVLIHQAYYRIALTQGNPADLGRVTQLYGVNGWGHAEWIHKDADGLYHLRRATYATCPPNYTAWRLSAMKITLNTKTGRGHAWDTRLKLGNVPIFYLPYYNFPIDDRRQSGFLVPMMGYNNREGMSISLPYYINLAPHYDLTLQPRWLSQRGIALGTEFRYLTQTSQGWVEGQLIPDDKRADRSDNMRAWVQWFQKTRFNPYWSAGIDASYVSDDNYFQDFGRDIAMITQNQLLRQVYLQYSDPHWDFLTNIENYQTLNPLNQPRVNKIYSRLPQVILSAHYPSILGPLNISLDSEYDHFIDGPTPVEGERWIINPRASFTLASERGYIEPAAELLSSFYRLHSTLPGTDKDIDRVLPRMSLDSGLFFEKNYTAYTQTLEPRLFYLYAPHRDQTNIPVFDSAYYVFNVDQLFRPNRFSGFDRISDANQLSAAFTSRILDRDTGFEHWRFAIGSTVYFQNRRVGLCEGAGCTDPVTRKGSTSSAAEFSPIVGEVNIQPNSQFSLLTNWAWDPDAHHNNNGAVRLHYQPGADKIIDLTYSFFVNGDPDKSGNDLHQIHLGFAWPLTKRWSTLGNWSYNLNADHDLSYYMGVQYENCCWALRLMGGKIFTNLNGDAKPEYQDMIYLQFLLRGLGTIGNRSPSAVLQTLVPGYRDIFKK